MRLLRKLVSDRNGFTMVSVVTGMLVIGMFSIGAYSAALGDISIGRKDQDRKRALEAAKAGIAWYAYHLYREPDFWVKCEDVGAAQPGLSLQGANRPANRWRTLPNNSEASFQVELMTADNTAVTQAQCEADPGGEMLDGGVLRIRSTGRVRGKTRQLVATFRRNTFLDYLWYTNWETSPPAAQVSPDTAPIRCDVKRSTRRGYEKVRNALGQYVDECSEIQFPSSDALAGPMHTEDESFLVCGSPTFGRNAADAVEVALAASPSSAFVPPVSGGCSASPNVDGTTVAPSKSLDLPPDNQDLADVADVTLTGQSCITFNGTSVTFKEGMNWNGGIDCDNGSGSETTAQLGANTVIFVRKGVGGCGKYEKVQKYPGTNSGCGDVAVRGTYGANVTVGSDDDIVVVDDLQKATSGNQMMGLIANDYVRVYHPADYYNNDANCYNNTNSSTPRVQSIDAAILALTGAFIVDNWECGRFPTTSNTLNVTGNIAQYWRGPVGTGTATTVSSGYRKNYVYDDRLKYRQPPSYLDPEESAWHMLRQSEQSPVK